MYNGSKPQEPVVKKNNNKKKKALITFAITLMFDVFYNVIFHCSDAVLVLFNCE